MKSPFNYTTRHFVLHLAVFLLLCNAISFYKSEFGFGASSITISGTVMLGAPRNTAVTNTAPGSVNITWDKSLSENDGYVAKYEVYAKLKTDVAYPGAPILTVTDIDGLYSEAITTGISTTAGMDFIVYALTSYDFMSPASNTATNQICPNALKEPGEACDGADLGGQNCTNFGYTGGTLSCDGACGLILTSCTSGGGGGGGGTGDTIPPIPGTATAPAYTNTKPTTINYSGASDAGGSGLNFVELWYKKGTSDWMYSGLTSSGGSGSFAFSGFTTDDTYYFDLVAQDGQGNRSSDPTSSGDTSTKYDTTAPNPGTATVATTSNSTPITVTYSGAGDGSGSGLKTVELWYKKGSTGTWTNSGLTKTTASGSFEFTDVTGDDTYYFDLVAEDNAGNKSAPASGSGDGHTAYSVIRPTVLLSGLPANPTHLSTTNITVYGDTVTAYKYKLDGGSYGAETLVATKITLSGLSSGTHTISVIGKNSTGNWQLETNATQYTWTVDFTVPTITISDPSDGLSTGGKVTYIVTYTNADTVTLSAGDITLNKTGTANGTVTVTPATPANPLKRKITIDNITGIGTLNISIATNTAQNINGNYAPSAGPSNSFNVNVYVPACGNGELNNDEECDDGNLVNGDGCSSTCTIENLCGNGVINTGEACDDGNSVNGDGCSSICAFEALCGNHILNTGEECDDGNTVSGDGCSSICVTEITHCTNGVKDADEKQIDCGGADCLSCHPAAPEHCSNEIKDEDESGVDCGGDECNACLTISFTALEKPEGRTTHAGDGVTSNIELNNRNISKVTNVKSVLFDALGTADFEITDILPGNYDAGIKGVGYLRAVIYNIPLMDELTVRTLDFTFGDTYELIGGDVWSDNIVNAGDVAQIIKTYATPNASVDMNRDGVVNAADMALVLRNYFKIGDSYF